MKTCNVCGETFDVSNFYRNAGKCKACHSAYSRERHRRNPDYKRNHNYMMRYGVSLAEVQEMLRLYPACALCLTPFTETKHHIDHDHTTGKIRGLLCSDCNRGIGLLKDDPDVLARGVEYIRRGNFS